MADNDIVQGSSGSTYRYLGTERTIAAELVQIPGGMSVGFEDGNVSGDPIRPLYVEDGAQAGYGAPLLVPGIFTGGNVDAAPTRAYLATVAPVQYVVRDHFEVDFVPVNDTAAYASGDCVGTITALADMAFANGGGGMIRQITVIDKDKLDAELEFNFFKATVAGTTNNAAFNPSDSEVLEACGTITVPAAAYRDFSANSIATIDDGLDYRCGSGTTSLYLQIVVRGTPTYTTNASALKIRITVERVA